MALRYQVEVFPKARIPSGAACNDINVLQFVIAYRFATPSGSLSAVNHNFKKKQGTVQKFRENR